MTQKEVAEALRISQRQLQKLEKAGAFPIPRLPALSRTPMYSREDVMRYTRGELKVVSQARGSRGRKAS